MVRDQEGMALPHIFFFFFFFFKLCGGCITALASECDTMGGSYVNTCGCYGVRKEPRQGP
jgi:hypothetical protein